VCVCVQGQPKEGEGMCVCAQGQPKEGEGMCVCVRKEGYARKGPANARQVGG